MAYELRRDEPVPAEVHRVMREQLDRMEALLRAREVHDTRKRLKETRSLLRLVRKPLGAMYAFENTFYRDLARELSAARDAEAVGEAIERLMKATDNAALRERLAIANERISGVDLLELEPLIAQLEAARVRLAQWPELKDDFDATLSDGLRRALRGGRRAFKRARQTRSAEDFHELRKRVKDHWYHARLVSPFRKHIERVDELSQLLGEQHDLVVTLQHIDDDALLPLIASERIRLEREALERAETLYDERPRKWVRRVRKQWR